MFLDDPETNPYAPPPPEADVSSTAAPNLRRIMKRDLWVRFWIILTTLYAVCWIFYLLVFFDSPVFYKNAFFIPIVCLQGMLTIYCVGATDQLFIALNKSLGSRLWIGAGFIVFFWLPLFHLLCMLVASSQAACILRQAGYQPGLTGTNIILISEPEQEKEQY